MVDMELPVLIEPKPPKTSSTAVIDIYQIDIRECKDKVYKRAANPSKIFLLILGQCSRTIRVEADVGWDT
jgi:hypothetical protein